ncbi:hypothetical protein K1719_010830 [Acacia pycnantha]|nr:hypothetical protein K1719_010830 [Acacia pycnantha]
MEAAFRVRVTVGRVLRDFCARRSALIKALTDDVDEFYDNCDPNVEELCLFGEADGRWRVAPPADIPSNLRRPARGINFVRDGMSREDWLNYVAYWSDIWLLCVAFTTGAQSGFRKEHRKMLYKKMEQLPKVLEVARIHRNARAQVERIFRDFRFRRQALINDLTEDVNEFYDLCVPPGVYNLLVRLDEDDDSAWTLGLFGDTSGLWRVGLRDVNVPPGLPQPVWGINLLRDLVPFMTWISWVARYSDVWLGSLASFEAANIGLHQVDRQKLNDMIGELPTLADIVDDYV